MELQHTPNNKLSRRNWLHDAAITATSAVVLPSLLIGCDDHRLDPLKGALQDVPLTSTELEMAANNLRLMDIFLADVHAYNKEYQEAVYKLLTGSKDNAPSGFKTFLLSLVTAIVIGVMGVVVAAANFAPPVGTIIAATVGAAIAIVSLNIKTWALDGGPKPKTLDGEFAEFELSQRQMRQATSDWIEVMRDATDNYRNLREGWKDAIDLNGKSYTLRDLANTKFPNLEKDSDTTTAYVAMRTAATEQFKRHIWNVMIIKAGSLSYGGQWYEYITDYDNKPPVFFARHWYQRADNKARYLRGLTQKQDGTFIFGSWIFTFDGKDLSAEAAAELFKDDTPGHIILNEKGQPSNGVFNRAYVYRQFHREAPSMTPFFDLREDETWGYDDSFKNYSYYGFAPGTDYIPFTGGEFPQLTK